MYLLSITLFFRFLALSYNKYSLSAITLIIISPTHTRRNPLLATPTTKTIRVNCVLSSSISFTDIYIFKLSFAISRSLVGLAGC